MKQERLSFQYNGLKPEKKQVRYFQEYFGLCIWRFKSFLISIAEVQNP